MNSANEIVLYQPNVDVHLEVMISGDIVWLAQQHMMEAFQTSKQNFSLHVNNIFKENELEKKAVVEEPYLLRHSLSWRTFPWT